MCSLIEYSVSFDNTYSILVELEFSRLSPLMGNFACSQGHDIEKQQKDKEQKCVLQR